ncbi:MAG: MFS transporter [Chloroflexota bacterium]
MTTDRSDIVEQASYLQRLFTSLAIPAYRWLWLNSVFGSMRLIAVFVVRGWLVLTITDSPFWVGAAPAVRGLTQIALGGFAGVLLDRVNRRTALFLSETGASLVAAGLAILVIEGRIELWHILVASVIEGVCVSVRWPAINVILVDVVGPERTLNATAAQMLGFNVGNIVASSIAGLIISAYGIGFGYLFGATCGLIGAVCTVFITGDFSPRVKETTAIAQKSVLQAVGAAFSYIRHYQLLLSMIILAFLMSLLGWANLSMLPVIARDILFVDASGLGFLTTAGAVGSLIATTIVAGLGDYEKKGRLIFAAGISTALFILLFSLSTNYMLSLFLIFLMQGALMAFEVTITASVLLMTAPHMQGRVQGLYTQVFGFTWVGGVVLGTIAELSSAPIAVAVGGAAIGGAVWLMRGQVATVDKTKN